LKRIAAAGVQSGACSASSFFGRLRVVLPAVRDAREERAAGRLAAIIVLAVGRRRRNASSFRSCLESKPEVAASRGIEVIFDRRVKRQGIRVFLRGGGVGPAKFIVTRRSCSDVLRE
jgi:hypothetical protein